MPCHTCGKTVTDGKKIGQKIRFCVCRSCNVCHQFFLCPDGKTWWLKLGDNETQKLFCVTQALPFGFPLMGIKD